MNTNNSPALSNEDQDVWSKVVCKDDPRNDEERRERELVNAIWPHVEANETAKHLFVSLLNHYNTIIEHLKYLDEEKWPKG